MNRPPARGLPPRIYLPILTVSALVVFAIVAYFLKVGLGTTGAALGPSAATPAPVAQAAPTPQPGEVVVPQTGGAPSGSDTTGAASAPGGGSSAGAPGGGPGVGVGGGGPAAQSGAGGAPPAPVQRMLMELRGRIARNPSDLSALVGLAQLYFDAGKFAQAIPYYRRALAVDPGNPDTRTDYATALHATGDELGALEQLAVVLKAKPNFPPALFNRGVVCATIGRRSEALDSFRTFLKVAPNDSKAGLARDAIANLGG